MKSTDSHWNTTLRAVERFQDATDYLNRAEGLSPGDARAAPRLPLDDIRALTFAAMRAFEIAAEFDAPSVSEFLADAERGFLGRLAELTPEHSISRDLLGSTWELMRERTERRAALAAPR